MKISVEPALGELV